MRHRIPDNSRLAATIENPGAAVGTGLLQMDPFRGSSMPSRSGTIAMGKWVTGRDRHDDVPTAMTLLLPADCGTIQMLVLVVLA